MPEIKIIALTGGDVGGKTSAVDEIKASFPDWVVFTNVEAATHISTNYVGDLVTLAKADFPKFVKIQKRILQRQLWELEHAKKIAKDMGHKKVLILLDQFGMDNAAYIGRDLFYKMLADEEYTLSQVRDAIHAVMHLTTAADGALEAFLKNWGNNPARGDRTPEEVIELDRRTMYAWVGHPHLRIIDNSTDFKGKMARLVEEIRRVLEGYEDERKFPLQRTPDWNIPELAHMQYADIRQMYLMDNRPRIRERIVHDSVTRFTTKKWGANREKERIISAAEFEGWARFRDHGARVIVKRRHYFIYEKQYFELDDFRDPAGIVLLELEVPNMSTPVKLPPFLDYYRDADGKPIEVTDDPRFKNKNMARLDWKMPMPA